MVGIWPSDFGELAVVAGTGLVEAGIGGSPELEKMTAGELAEAVEDGGGRLGGEEGACREN